MFYEIISNIVMRIIIFNLSVVCNIILKWKSPLNVMFSLTSNDGSKFKLYSSSIVMLCNTRQAIRMSTMTSWSHCLLGLVIFPNCICGTPKHHFTSSHVASYVLANCCCFPPLEFVDNLHKYRPLRINFIE
jgi:hypothetical protein